MALVTTVVAVTGAEALLRRCNRRAMSFLSKVAPRCAAHCLRASRGEAPYRDVYPSVPSSRDACISAFDRIKNDEVVLEPPSADQKRLSKRVAVDFGMLSLYAQELDAVLANATFTGATHIPVKKPYVEAKPLDAALLHFRGFERGDSLCLFYQRSGFALVPSPAASYAPATERQLSYFETVISGLSGLRVSRVHCPYFFKSVLAIDLRPAHQHLEDADARTRENYRLAIVFGRMGNRLMMLDNNDGVVLLTSETFDEKSGIRDGVGSVFQPEASGKVTPDPSETYARFVERFAGKQHMSLLKAMLLTYEGMDARRVNLLAGRAGVDCTRHVSKIDNLSDFYRTFIGWLKAPAGSSEQLTFVDLPAEGEGAVGTAGASEHADVTTGPAEKQDGAEVQQLTAIGYVFRHWGSGGPVYSHQRLAEEARVLIDATVERLDKIRQQCIGDEQQAERLAKVQARLNDLLEYSRSLSTVMKWKSPEQFDLVRTIHEQVADLGDLTGYRKKGASQRGGARSRRDSDEGEREPTVTRGKAKKVDPFRGILVIKTDPQDPETSLIIVGRNAEQNERVTHEIARPGDVWLHVKDCPGSHVLLRRPGGSADALQVAADVAAYYSKAKSSAVVAVIKTGIENVSRCEGAQVGAVLVSRFTTLDGRPARGGEYVKAHRLALN
ncbi:fibronectin-binding A domain protein [Babesia caballi]|uniref:Fibronectin-binding A domain protein n=1 Tax=Babesia caballi TaxID=5871 RepID=A0AAV4LVV0_BABCB|nr:fibronectin-binding A domain protein [Babesia caballi]